MQCNWIQSDYVSSTFDIFSAAASKLFGSIIPSSTSTTKKQNKICVDVFNWQPAAGGPVAPMMQPMMGQPMMGQPMMRPPFAGVAGAAAPGAPVKEFVSSEECTDRRFAGV